MIRLLDARLASRIAAGEVIERPQSILREFLDNSLDAGASEIRVEIEGGGIDRLSVIDNGSGITREDLSILGNRHATSKIHDEDDLYSITTLGFRGEALYSIGAVSKLTIKTRSADSGEASTLIIDNGTRMEIIPSGPDRGTIATAENLFSDIPARRAFLKRPQTEAQMIRSLLISKALAFPSVRFSLVSDGALRLDWPQAETLKERAMMLYRSEGIADADVEALHTDGEGFSVDIIAGNSAVKRSDRKEIRVYVNNRPVDDYPVQQAVTYGYGELLPGGSFPVAAVFIHDSPELADFNIHPTKREVKLRNKAEIHHAITTLIQSGIKRRIPEIVPKQPEFYLDAAKRTETGKSVPTYSKSPSTGAYRSPDLSFSERIGSAYKESDRAWLEKAKALKEREAQRREERKTAETCSANEERKVSFRYIGQAFSLFLIAEVDGELLFIDQHAAHERILYDELIKQKSIQKLLVPIHIETDGISSEFLDEHSHVYTKLGIMLSKREDGEWEITALPASCRPIETEIVDFIQSSRLDENELESKLFAVIACRAAIKAGDSIDRWSAESLIEKALMLDEPACPHGRTFIIKLSEKDLRMLAGRTS